MISNHSGITKNFIQIRSYSSIFVLSLFQNNVNLLKHQKPCKRSYWKYVENKKKTSLSCNRQSSFNSKLCNRQLTVGPLWKSLQKRMYDAYRRFDAWIEHVSPSAKHYLNIFTNGAVTTWSDIKTYRHVANRLKVNPSASVSYSEAMKIHMIKRDAIKAAPLLPFCLIPFGFVMLVIPAYLFPRYVLPHAFWSDSQRQNFYMQFHQGRLKSYDIILHHMNYHKQNTTNMDFRHVLENLCSTIQSKNIPSNHLLLQLKPFCNYAQSPLNLEIKNVNILLRSFSRVILANSILPSTWLFNQLKSYGVLIINLDKKIRFENLISKLSIENIETANLMRGLNSANLSYAANIYWLKNWVELTKLCNENDYWFVLHAMILLSMNYTEIKFQRKVFG